MLSRDVADFMGGVLTVLVPVGVAVAIGAALQPVMHWIGAILTALL